MNIYNHIQSKVYSGDDDYDKFSGYVTKTYTVEWEDSSGTRWRKTCQVINLGRPDRVPPADPDALMGAERLSYEGERPNQRKRDERHAALAMDLTRYLRQYGPSHMTAMASDLDYAKTTLDEFVRQREGRIFCKVGNVGRAVLWGLVGIHDKGDGQ